MKSLLVFLLIPVFMLNASLGELFKVPVILSHFSEHQQVKADLGLLEFLSMHYLGDDMNDKDQDRDMQLPFKKIDLNLSFEIVAIPVNLLILEKKQFFHPNKTPLPLSRDLHLSNPYLDGLFRPPIV